MRVKPVGYVRTSLKDAMPFPHDGGHGTEKYVERLKEYHRQIKDLESELVIFPELQDVLEGIEEFSHIFVLYWAHLVPEARKGTLQVHPMGRRDMPKKGVFATCSPILDIKPYIKDYHCVESATVPEWMKRLREEVKDNS